MQSITTPLPCRLLLQLVSLLYSHFLGSLTHQETSIEHLLQYKL